MSTQLIELGIPVVMAVNMMDIVEKNGDKIDIKALGDKLGCEVVTISALKGTGIKEAAEKAVKAAESKKNVQRVHKFADDIEEVITSVEGKLVGVAMHRKDSLQLNFLNQIQRFQTSLQQFLMYQKKLQNLKKHMR